MTVILDSRADFTRETARRVAWVGERVRFSDGAKAAMAAARARFEALLDDPEIVIYGVTSGYGQNAWKRFDALERAAHAAAPPVRPAASWGDPLPDRVTRTVVLARLANFVEGHAAVTPALAERAAAMLDGGPLPEVPARGQGGAGEILALTHLFLDLMESHSLAEKDAIAMINGSPVAAALVTDAALAWEGRLSLAAEVLALAAEGLNAPLGHYDEALETAWGNPHDAWGLARMRRLIDGGHGGPRRPYQAPVSFRIAPRLLGQGHLALTVTQSVADASLGAVTDNPLILPPDTPDGPARAISTGGFHDAQAPMAMDQLTAAAANLCCLAGRMIDATLHGPVSGLPPQLGVDEGLPYLGTLGMAATGYEEEARGLATATLIPGSAAGGFGQNDMASPAPLAWSKQDRAGLLLEHTLAALATVAVRALHVTGRPVPQPLRGLAAEVEETVDHLDPRTRPGPATAELAERFRGRILTP